jgi:uncharacterized membrane protein YphA (DoxX/SURF4 family)
MTIPKNNSRAMTSQRLFWAGRLLLGAMFIIASLDKIHHPAAFARIIYNYQIISGIWINITAAILPWIELVLGICLIAGLWKPGTLLLSNLLLSVFTVLLILNLTRGLDINCGCFSTNPSQMVSTAWEILRDFLFLILAIYLIINYVLRGYAKMSKNAIAKQ